MTPTVPATSSRRARTHRTASVPPHAFFAVSAIFHYLGPAFAVLLFARIDVLGVAWLRIASAAVVFAAWRRPWRIVGGLSPTQRRLLLWLGAVLAAMNTSFYLAIERLPLGTVAALEFLGPVMLAAVGARAARNWAALGLAAAGVYVLTDLRLAGEPLGYLFAFLNCGLFVAYIVIGHRIAADGGGRGVDRLGCAMLVAAVVALPIGVADAAEAINTPMLIAAGIGVGVCSSVVPYVADQLAMARLSRSTFALMLSILPATATLIGVAVLGQVPTAIEIVGIALVAAGIGLHRGETDRAPRGATSHAKGARLS